MLRPENSSFRVFFSRRDITIHYDGIRAPAIQVEAIHGLNLLWERVSAEIPSDPKAMQVNRPPSRPEKIYSEKIQYIAVDKLQFTKNVCSKVLTYYGDSESWKKIPKTHRYAEL